jgi:hypothetical protein
MAWAPPGVAHKAKIAAKINPRVGGIGFSSNRGR